jgi:hypothetical protein
MGYTFDTFPSGTYPQVDYYADLPLSPVPGDIYAVLNSSGIWPINYHASGLYRWTGTAWVKFDDLQEILNNQTLTDINGPLVGVGGVITTGSVGVTDHDLLNNLDYASAGHTGFQPAGNYITGEGKVIVINQIDPEVPGKQHQSYASARAWLLANSVPSSSNKWIIRFYGVLTENLTGANSCLRYVTIDGGDKNNSYINGSVDFAERGEDWSAVSNKIQNCSIANLAVTNTGGGQGKGCTFENVYIATVTTSGPGHYINCLDCGLEGDFSSFNGDGATNAKSVIVGGTISSWGTATTVPVANWYIYGCNFGNGAWPVLTLQGGGSWSPLNLKDCYFESWGTIVFNGEINWADCDFNSGAADIVLNAGCVFNVCNTVFRSNIILNPGSTLNSTDLVFVGAYSVVLSGGTWNNKGSAYDNRTSLAISKDLQGAADELFAEKLDSVVAGTGISVDSTDPRNPIITSTVPSGITDHYLLSNLDYISSGHKGFQPTSQITKNITYNLDGTVNVITDAMGTKTMAYNLDGTLASITGTGVYVTKTFTYTGGVLTDITVS